MTVEPEVGTKVRNTKKQIWNIKFDFMSLEPEVGSENNNKEKIKKKTKNRFKILSLTWFWSLKWEAKSTKNIKNS